MISLTARDFDLLFALASYYVLSRASIQQLLFPQDDTGRATRRRLTALVAAKLINRTAAPLYNARGGSPWPAYYPARRGCELLAEHTGDERYLLTPTRAPEPLYLHHWLAISETHLTLDAAVARQEEVRIEDWINEWDVVNKDEAAPASRGRRSRSRPRRPCRRRRGQPRRRRGSSGPGPRARRSGRYYVWRVRKCPLFRVITQGRAVAQASCDIGVAFKKYKT